MTRHRDSTAFIDYLENTILDLTEPIEEIAKTKLTKNNEISDACEMMLAELRQIGTHFASRDRKICDAEASFIADIEEFLNEEIWHGFTNYELSEMMEEEYEQDPYIYEFLDVPKSVKYLRIYDDIEGTNYATQAITMFFRFANAVAKADGIICQREEDAIYNFKKMLFTKIKKDEAVIVMPQL